MSDKSQTLMDVTTICDLCGKFENCKFKFKVNFMFQKMLHMLSQDV